ncbi:MAG: hypothetical protein LRZ85_07875 [Alphaproteobacteria bacterium]|nr:hypothetical protein [Alphaproteobacteria bacterium]MCD8570456.1 hypothetical protein [Alphaproteobacteria bacterium]
MNKGKAMTISNHIVASWYGAERRSNAFGALAFIKGNDVPIISGFLLR